MPFNDEWGIHGMIVHINTFNDQLINLWKEKTQDMSLYMDHIVQDKKSS